MTATLHLVRAPATILVPVAEPDTVVYLEGAELRLRDGTLIDHDHLLALVVAARRVITW